MLLALVVLASGLAAFGSRLRPQPKWFAPTAAALLGGLGWVFMSLFGIEVIGDRGLHAIRQATQAGPSALGPSAFFALFLFSFAAFHFQAPQGEQLVLHEHL